MSAWSDWKCGAITWEEYKLACMEEERKDNEMYENSDEDEEESD